MQKIIIAVAIALTLAACTKSENASAPSAPTVTEAQKEQALQQFHTRKTKKVRTMEEIEAEKKAEATKGQ